MKKSFYIAIIFLFTLDLLSHEKFIKGMAEHKPYLKGQHVKSIGDLRLIKNNELNNSLEYSKIKSKNLYGIGMPKRLNSELLMTSGRIFEGKFVKHKYTAKELKNEDKEIAFLAYVNVKQWTTILLPKNIVSFKQLEEVLPRIAKGAGINSDVPFPFILKSHIKSLKWFIVNGMGNGQPNHLASFLRSRYIGGLDNIEIEGIGFYSKKHKGILSSPASSMHIHFRTIESPLFVGHIDNEMLLSGNTEILFPIANTTKKIN